MEQILLEENGKNYLLKFEKKDDSSKRSRKELFSL